MTASILAVACVIVSAIASHAFHSWLKLSERERLSATDRAVLEAKFTEQAEWKNKVNQFMANARPR